MISKEQVIQIKKDLNLQNFSIHGSRKNFDRKWASEVNLSLKAIENIRIGRTWKDLLV